MLEIIVGEIYTLNMYNKILFEKVIKIWIKYVAMNGKCILHISFKNHSLIKSYMHSFYKSDTPANV